MRDSVFLQVHESFMVTPCCDLKRVQMFTQHALSRVMMGWGTCTFYFSVGTHRRCLLHMQGGEAGRRVESGGSKAGRHVSLVSKVGWTNKTCWVCAGSARPSKALTCHPSQVRLECCKEG